jgi:spermidine synthase
MRDPLPKVMLAALGLAAVQFAMCCARPAQAEEAPVSQVVGDMRIIPVKVETGDGAYTVSKLDGSRTGYYYDLGERAGELRPHAHRVVMLGMGGGEMLRAVRRRLPKADLLGIDSDPKMVRAAKDEFHVGAFGARTELGDAFQRVKGLRGVDILLVDLFVEGDRMPPAMFLPQFWQDCAAALGEHGLVGVNVYPQRMVEPVVVIMESQGLKVLERDEVKGSTVVFGSL